MPNYSLSVCSHKCTLIVLSKLSCPHFNLTYSYFRVPNIGIYSDRTGSLGFCSVCSWNLPECVAKACLTFI
uniref:Uncharacterized protein n=1 Tax=Anguilla anguilla TaxID=7936 RepID=A0A0E9PHI6_ANGAN